MSHYDFLREVRRSYALIVTYVPVASAHFCALGAIYTLFAHGERVANAVSDGVCRAFFS